MLKLIGSDVLLLGRLLMLRRLEFIHRLKWPNFDSVVHLAVGQFYPCQKPLNISCLTLNSRVNFTLIKTQPLERLSVCCRFYFCWMKKFSSFNKTLVKSEFIYIKRDRTSLLTSVRALSKHFGFTVRYQQVASELIFHKSLFENRVPLAAHPTHRLSYSNSFFIQVVDIRFVLILALNFYDELEASEEQKRI